MMRRHPRSTRTYTLVPYSTLFRSAPAAPDTINRMPEKTVRAFADHGKVRGAMAEDGGDYAATLDKITAAGVDIDALAAQLQREGAESFVKSWNQLKPRIADKAQSLAGTHCDGGHGPVSTVESSVWNAGASEV